MPEAPILIVRLSERAYRQCRRAGGTDAERRVCNAVANGFRTRRAGGRVLFRHGAHGGTGPVRVLGRVARSSCLVLQVLSGLGSAKKLRKSGIFDSRRPQMSASTRAPF